MPRKRTPDTEPPRFVAIIAAAAALQADSDRGYWALADALLAEVPNPDELGDVKAELDLAGVTTTTGSAYTASGLGVLRTAASNWSAASRQTVATFDTHVAVGTRKRSGFLALCAHALGVQVNQPEGVTPEAWSAAAAIVDERKARSRPPRFLVGGDELRLLFERATTVATEPEGTEPEGTEPDTEGTEPAGKAITASLDQVADLVRETVRATQRSADGLDGVARAELASRLRGLVELLDMALAALLDGANAEAD